MSGEDTQMQAVFAAIQAGEAGQWHAAVAYQAWQESERQLATSKAELERVIKCLAESDDACDVVEAQLAEAERDTQRLDWVERQKYSAWGITPNLMQNGWEKAVETGGESYRGLSLRACVDAAREGEKP